MEYAYLHRDKLGKIVSVDIVDGTTITDVVDIKGETPQPPLPAYIQKINGQPWAHLTTDDLVPISRRRTL